MSIIAANYHGEIFHGENFVKGKFSWGNIHGEIFHGENFV